MPEMQNQSKKIIIALAVILAVAFVGWWLASKKAVQPDGGNLPTPTPAPVFIPDFLGTLSGIVSRRDASSFVLETKTPEGTDMSKLRAEERTVTWTKDTKFLMSDGYPTDETPTKEIKSEEVKAGDAVVVTSDENVRSSQQFTAKSVTVYGRVGNIPIGQFSFGSGPVIGRLTGIQGRTLTVKFEPSTPLGDLKNPEPELISPGVWTVRLASSANFNRVVSPRPKSSSTPPNSSSPISITPISIGDLTVDTMVAVYFLKKDEANKVLESNRVDIMGTQK